MNDKTSMAKTDTETQKNDLSVTRIIFFFFHQMFTQYRVVSLAVDVTVSFLIVCFARPSTFKSTLSLITSFTYQLKSLSWRRCCCCFFSFRYLCSLVQKSSVSSSVGPWMFSSHHLTIVQCLSHFNFPSISLFDIVSSSHLLCFSFVFVFLHFNRFFCDL